MAAAEPGRTGSGMLEPVGVRQDLSFSDVPENDNHGSGNAALHPVGAALPAALAPL